MLESQRLVIINPISHPGAERKDAERWGVRGPPSRGHGPEETPRPWGKLQRWLSSQQTAWGHPGAGRWFQVGRLAGYRGRSPTHTHTMPPLNPSRWHRRPPPLHNASHPVSETLVSARTHENKGKQKPRESSHI